MCKTGLNYHSKYQIEKINLIKKSKFNFSKKEFQCCLYFGSLPAHQVQNWEHL